jgi:hypothetical protein
MVARPAVGMDVDGTAAYWHEHFLWFAGLYLGRQMPPQYLGTAPLHIEMGISKRTYRQVKLAYRQSGLKRAIAVREGAAELARDVRKAGAELWVCTTRPYLRLDNIDPDTRAWLRRNRIQYDGVLFGERKYADFARLVGSGRVIGVIDDLPEQVEKAFVAGLPARLIERQYNQDHPYVKEGHSLPSLHAARDWLLEEIEKWKVNNGV